MIPFSAPQTNPCVTPLDILQELPAAPVDDSGRARQLNGKVPIEIFERPTD